MRSVVSLCFAVVITFAGGVAPADEDLLKEYPLLPHLQGPPEHRPVVQTALRPQVDAAAARAWSKPTVAVPPRLSVRVKGARGCMVRVDAKPVGRPPVRGLLLVAGSHRIVVKCKKRRRISRRVTLDSGQHARLILRHKRRAGWAVALR